MRPVSPEFQLEHCKVCVSQMLVHASQWLIYNRARVGCSPGRAALGWAAAQSGLQPRVGCARVGRSPGRAALAWAAAQGELG